MSEVANVLDEFKRIYNGDAWHGPSLKEILTGMTPELAAARPLAGAHSIWELVLHIVAWEEVFCRRLEGQRADEPEEGDFPPVSDISQDAWAQVLARLDRSHDRLIEVTSTLTDSALTETVAGKDFSISFLLHGIVRHNIYHAGQIALLKKAGQ